MAPRGLSVEEKRVKLLEIFHESKDFYQLKELEKLGPKLKGIVSQSVKEILQSLVDDGLVQSDKIGSSNCACALTCIYALIFSDHSLLELPLSAREHRMLTYCLLELCRCLLLHPRYRINWVQRKRPRPIMRTKLQSYGLHSNAREL
ncbi:hypothetical protein PAXRUDRAFT_825284 [Paxillus rubicundulus Ve08.2h10]|uniref:Mnd1 HTH domain-containing protein n=1 Tax=Paxillus rubicundulus Ve08.2h10 TaxID=930991 RepID=A0A0D0DGL3_9AGAM|nr:hypothetical protein PAXRUDRAFT_825284 [Paxillus rubicundulus Ve08.2h10]